MAGVGLAIPIAAKYTDDGFGNIRYTQGLRFAKAIEYSTEFGDSKKNNLYADNSIAETQNVFSGGTITLKTDSMDFAASKLILGLTEKDMSYNGKTVKVLVNRDGDTSPYLGLGVIVKHQRNSIPFFEANILPKVSFAVPSEAAKTEGESIEWQTPQIQGTIMRDDTPEHNWRYKAEFPTEAAAIEFIKWLLGLLPPVLTVTSSAGATEGKSAIVVTPVKQAGNSYQYLIGKEVYIPDKDAAVTDAYLSWDGTEEVEAKTGEKILVVEATAEGKVQRAGIATVVSKEVLADGENQ